MTTYQPTGTGLCKVCGHDVGRHDDGHEFLNQQAGGYLMPRWPCAIPSCRRAMLNPIHDVGRVLRCPKEDTP